MESKGRSLDTPLGPVIGLAGGETRLFARISLWLNEQRRLVPLAGIEPALLAELDFESSASTSSATGALGWSQDGASRSRRTIAMDKPRSTRAKVIPGVLDRGLDGG